MIVLYQRSSRIRYQTGVGEFKGQIEITLMAPAVFDDEVTAFGCFGNHLVAGAGTESVTQTADCRDARLNSMG